MEVNLWLWREGFIPICLHKTVIFLGLHVPIKIKLVRSRDPFHLVSSEENPNYKVVIQECVFRVRRVTVAPSVLMSHGQSVQQTTAKYPINRIDCKVVSVPRGNMSGNQPNIFQGALPNRIVIGIVDADAFNGTYAKNPFNFKNYDLTIMGLTVNGENLPGKPLQLKFGQGSNCISAFQTLYAGTHKMFENQGNGITREEYANGYTLFVFDLTPDLCLGDHAQPIKKRKCLDRMSTIANMFTNSREWNDMLVRDFIDKWYK